MKPAKVTTRAVMRKINTMFRNFTAASFPGTFTVFRVIMSNSVPAFTFVSV